MSMKNTAIKIAIKRIETINSTDMPNFKNKLTNMPLVKSSIKGYLIDIFSLQYLHLPFKKRKLKTGTKSFGLRFLLQEVQCEEGQTIDSPRGILYMQTFKKEPASKPKIIVNTKK
jgi:hypothetical protein